MTAIGCGALGEFVALVLTIPGVSSFVVPGRGQMLEIISAPSLKGRARVSAMVHRPSSAKAGAQVHTWAPQDLTKDCPGYMPIPGDDYVKKYQRNRALWPVEFFLIVYRRARKARTQKRETQVLVRKSANGTSKWGLGTGVPATRWVLSSQERPPLGYTWSEPRIRFEARNYPEFPKSGQESWAYDKIDIREDAFNGPDATNLKDPELEEYARKIRQCLRRKLSEQIDDGKNEDSWEASALSVVKNIVDSAKSVAAIQGTLRMSGIFAQKQKDATGDGSPGPRYVGLGENAPDPAELVQSMRIFTMFPQMPDPMPLPSTSSEELQKEITSREFRMAERGRDPHRDRHGRIFTHKSTSNVSNTIHGVYLTLDATNLPGLDEAPALDLFGTKEVRREWKSLQELKVLDADGKSISLEDTKPTFISGFIVRQLVKDGVINVDGS